MYCACMTFTWSKVKVIDLLKFYKMHFSMSISSAVWLIRTVWDLPVVYSHSEPDFWISPPVAGHVTSEFAKCWHHQNSLPFISTLAEARSLWLWLQVGHNKPCMLAAMTISPLAGLSGYSGYSGIVFVCNGTDRHEIQAKTSVSVFCWTLIEEFWKLSLKGWFLPENCHFGVVLTGLCVTGLQVSGYVFWLS